MMIFLNKTFEFFDQPNKEIGYHFNRISIQAYRVFTYYKEGIMGIKPLINNILPAKPLVLPKLNTLHRQFIKFMEND